MFALLSLFFILVLPRGMAIPMPLAAVQTHAPNRLNLSENCLICQRRLTVGLLAVTLVTVPAFFAGQLEMHCCA